MAEGINEDKINNAAAEAKRLAQEQSSDRAGPLSARFPQYRRNRGLSFFQNVLSGTASGVAAAQGAIRAGDPISAALLAAGGAMQAPTQEQVQAAREAEIAKARLSALEMEPIQRHAPGMVRELASLGFDLEDVPLGIVNKLAPLIDNATQARRQMIAEFQEFVENKRKERELDMRQGERAADRSAKEAAAASGKRISGPTLLGVNEGKSVARLLPDVEKAIQANAAMFGPISGRAKSANPYNESAQTVDALMRTASQSFGRFMERGVLRKEDEEKYRRMFPQLSDKLEVAKNKLAIVRRILAQEYESQRSVLGDSGYDISGLGALDIPPSIFERASSGPAVGVVEDGYRFKGGDPANPASWEKV
jgi:hypothetical protein